MMETPLAYIPIDRRLAMAHGVDLPDRAEGAALFADISGFTPLTDAMAKELGPKRGAEELTRQLNIVYGALIGEVDCFRGSVIGFAGDAITCWFDGDDGLRAVTCAMGMQKVMQQFAEVKTPGGTIVSLAVKVAVAVGPARRFRVGDARFQHIDVLAGETLSRMADGEHHAEKGDVVDPEAVVQLEGKVTVRECREDEETGQRFAVLDRLLMAAPAQG